MVTPRYLALLLAAALAVSLGTGAADASEPDPAEGATLQETLETARASNPEIRAARLQWESARARVGGAAVLRPPRLDLERMYAPSFSGLASADEKSFALSQEVPFPSKLRTRKALARSEAAMAEQAYEAKVREVLAGVRTTYAMLYLAERGLEIAAENVDLMRRFSTVAESKYAAGRAGQADALKAQVELTKMLNMRALMERERDLARAMLNAALGREAAAPMGPAVEPSTVPFSLDLGNLEEAALTARPELRQAALSAERSEASLSLARSEYLPDFMLLYRRRSDSMRGTTHDGMVGLTLPLWFWGPKAMVAEAEAEKDMAEAELEAMRLRTLAELRSALFRVETAQRLAEVYRTSVLPQAEAALRVAETGYQSDRTGFLDLLDAQRSLLDLRLESYGYQAEVQARLAELERVAGRSLP